MIPNYERLLRLAAFLDELPNSKFFFGSVIHKTGTTELEPVCGTVCCALGWLPRAFPGEAKWIVRNETIDCIGPITEDAKGPWEGTFEFADRFFNIDKFESEALFCPQSECGHIPWLSEPLDFHATPVKVAAGLRAFVAFRKGGGTI
jgi:hypothetical protein